MGQQFCLNAAIFLPFVVSMGQAHPPALGHSSFRLTDRLLCDRRECALRGSLGLLSFYAVLAHCRTLISLRADLSIWDARSN